MYITYLCTNSFRLSQAILHICKLEQEVDWSIYLAVLGYPRYCSTDSYSLPLGYTLNFGSCRNYLPADL